MSQITIREQEQVGFNSFDVTENVVLVPLLDDSSGGQKTTLCSTLNEFIATFGRTAPTLGSEVDYSYYFIKELLNAGLKVVVKPFVAQDGDTEIGEALRKQIGEGTSEDSDGLFTEFGSKNLWNIKFITTGYWPNVILSTGSVGKTISGGCYGIMANIAQKRGDCVAVFEFEQEVEPSELIDAIDSSQADGMYKYAVACYPAAEFNLVTSTSRTLETKLVMPASFGYLMAFANSVRTNATWFAASGIIRGVIPNLIAVEHEVTESMMQYMQDGNTNDKDARSWKVNPIMQVGSYGIRLWGNRVVGSGSNFGVGKLKFSDFMNVRMLLCDLKKQIYHAALRTTFEPNDDITWVNFKKLCNGLLDQMQSGRGISWYSWKREKVDVKATIKAVLTIKPIEAVEYFDITIDLTDEEVSVAEEEEQETI